MRPYDRALNEGVNRVFRAIRKAYERRRRPMYEHHYLVIADIGLAYGRCPNAANTGIRRSLLSLTQRFPQDTSGTAHIPAPGCTGSYVTGTLANWADGLELLSARQLTRLYSDIFVFAAVRDPVSRLAACYLRDLDGGRSIPASGVYYGFRPNMSFAAFAARVCDIPDEKSSNGYRSQASILTRKGRLVPDFIVRHEHAEHDWPILRTTIERHCRVDIGPLNTRDEEEETQIKDLVTQLDPAIVYALKQRYRKDLELFYSNDSAS